MVKSCWKPSVEGEDGEGSGKVDGLLWHKDLGNHLYGDFSMAVVQANSSLEDRSQLESGPFTCNNDNMGPQGTVIGVYDGHGGYEASQFVTDNLFSNLKRLAGEEGGMAESVIKKAYRATDEGFLSMVKRKWMSKPEIASTGTCCLVGIICNGMIYIANSGDSRAVLGRMERATKEVVAIQLSAEHNVNIETVRDEVRSKHPFDSQIVVLKHQVWRVKGLIQVSRSIGDAYLKKAEFNREPLPLRFRLAESFFKPILSCEPSIATQKLHPDDHFLIFASDGLWEHLSNQEAVNMVNNNPRNGIARRLVKAAMKEAAKKREMKLADLEKIEAGARRHFHDDITVVVVFLNPKLTDNNSPWGSPLSIKAGWPANP
ncbi:probable protein phosphatase 2C 38 isoform X1 [Neltuma alba]|uniref:probable protein phosphatase 2C 38 isoform X1 n=2 Tax=Neltuma alba TaxID=207710 RepID=UPI0010A4E81C|nr:probable protein phosphatase 2C 38 isoform X1 [Prosopis alba]XP_028775116.1 probable protein phosphatase 2C 38 isoform X1 [Prosopis alba]